MRVTIQMECSECKRRNYTTAKNKRTTTGRLEVKKYCPWCRGHRPHKETK